MKFMLKIIKNCIFASSLFIALFMNAEILPLDGKNCEIPIDKNLYDNGSITYRLNFNNRKYVKNALSSFLKLDSHTSKKKWIKADLIVKKGVLTCTYKTKIRVTGDLEDHYDFKSSPEEFRTSLLIRLLDDNINGITSFKIFIPESRLNNNEILSALLFKRLGFLSPRTYKVDFSLNGNISKFILQEDITKEFLENNNRTEGPILEGDERFGLTKPFSLSRVSNYNWIDENNSKLVMSINAITKLNHAYLSTSINFKEDDGGISETFNNDIPVNINALGVNSRDSIGMKQIKSFYALSYALKATHGLSKDDSRFYFNPVFGRIEPIYYDGIARIKAEFKPKEINSFVHEGLVNIKNEINLLDLSEIYKSFSDVGGDLTFKEFLFLFDKINENINYLLSLPVVDYKLQTFDNDEYFIEFLRLHYKDSYKTNYINYEGYYNQSHYIYKCDQNNECNKESVSFNDIRLGIGQRLLDKISSEPIIFFRKSNSFKENNKSDIFSLKSIALENNTNIYLTDDVFLSVDEEERIIKIATNSEKNAVLFTGDSLNNWNIEYTSKINKDDLSKTSPGISVLGLTGCLNFHDIKLINVRINSENSTCEDGIHLLRANGTIAEINVNNALSDAIDFDFSTVTVDRIIVNNSVNDCIDLSSGNYLINNINVTGCGDKGISLGEDGYAKLIYANIHDSEIGVASKDSSKMEIDYAKINVFDYCATLYRKKQEYNGANMSIKEISCDLDTYFVQEGSELIIQKKLVVNK